MSPRTAKRVQAREAARKRIEQARAARRERDRVEEQNTVEFELARQRRDQAAREAADAERDMAAHIGELIKLGNKVDQVAMLTGEPEQEVRRLLRLGTDKPRSTGSTKQQPNSVTGRGTAASLPASSLATNATPASGSDRMIQSSGQRM